MKYIKLYIIIIFTAVVLVCGCTDLSQYVSVENYNSKVSELEEANSETEAKSKEILELKEEVDTLENDLELSKEEAAQYRDLISNLNELLKNIYYVYGEGSGTYVCGTGFSLEYENKVYLITAGHAIEDRDGKYYNHRFKANFTDKWIYPKLLAYENDYYGNRDYAILSSEKVTSGLDFDLNNSYPKFILGNMNDNTLKEFSNRNLMRGESGSPIIDLDGQVIEIATGYYVDIGIVIEAIDNLK